MCALDFGCGRPCDRAAQVPAVLADREHEGASDAVHRQIADIPVVTQRWVRTVPNYAENPEIPQVQGVAVDVLVNSSDKLQQFSRRLLCKLCRKPSSFKVAWLWTSLCSCSDVRDVLRSVY